VRQGKAPGCGQVCENLRVGSGERKRLFGPHFGPLRRLSRTYIGDMRTCLLSFSRGLAWLLAGLLSSGLAHAQAVAPQTTVAPQSEFAQLEQMARDWVQPAMAAAVGVDGGGQLRPEILMGSLDSRLRLAPCARIEPYLPPGTRLWGRSRVGLRCLEGAVRWNVYLPVTVKAWGPGWVIKRPVAAGSVLAQEDAEMAEMDWAEQPYAVLANPDRWVGQQAAYALQPGQAIRQNMVRPVAAFGPGAQVRVSSVGAGFQVVVSGEALTAGVPGQNVRVRLAGGRIVTGTVRDGQTVDVRL
jgi:flagellar basal body P-ring formation protein FlgA